MRPFVAVVGRAYMMSLLAVGALSEAPFARADSLFNQPDTTTAADSVVAFNEIMYHPDADNSSLEWVELYNQMSVDIELSNWRIEGGIDFRFPTNTILAAGNYLVVAADPAALQTARGVTNVFGPFTRRSEEHTSELQSRLHLVCRLLLEKKKK